MATRYSVLGLIGSALLAVGAVIHLVLGYPALKEGIAAAHLSIEPGLKAVWIALSFNLVFLAGIGFAQMRSATPSRNIVLLVAAAALSNALTVQWFIRHLHPAVPIFGLAGIFLLLAAIRIHSHTAA